MNYDNYVNAASLLFTPINYELFIIIDTYYRSTKTTYNLPIQETGDSVRKRILYPANFSTHEP